jgi:hypothetical protein
LETTTHGKQIKSCISRQTDRQTDRRPQLIDPEQHQQQSRGCTRLFPLPPRQRGDHGSLIKQAKGYFMSSVQLVRSNPPPPWPKSSLFVRKLLNGAVLDANYQPTLRQLGTLPGVFFFLFFVFFWHYKNRFFQANFLEKFRQDVKICPQNAALPPPPFFCQSEAIGAPSI